MAGSNSRKRVCLLTEDEIVASLKNTSNLLASRRVLLEAAHSLDSQNKTVHQANLTTQVENYEFSAIKYEQTAETIVALEQFTKTADQSVILNHLWREEADPETTSCSQVSKVNLDSNQVEAIVDHFNENGEQEKEDLIKKNIENKMRISETLPQLRKLFEKTEKDEQNIERFNKANKYLQNMEFMRNVTQRLIADCTFKEVMASRQLRDIHLRTLKRRTLVDYYKSRDPTVIMNENESRPVDDINPVETNDSINNEEPMKNSHLSPPLYNSDPPLTNDSEFDYLDYNRGSQSFRASSNSLKRTENGVNNVSFRHRTASNTMRSERKQSDQTFRSEMLNGTRTTRNEVSGIARLNLNDTESESAFNVADEDGDEEHGESYRETKENDEYEESYGSYEAMDVSEGSLDENEQSVEEEENYDEEISEEENGEILKADDTDGDVIAYQDENNEDSVRENMDESENVNTSVSENMSQSVNNESGTTNRSVRRSTRGSSNRTELSAVSFRRNPRRSAKETSRNESMKINNPSVYGKTRIQNVSNSCEDGVEEETDNETQNIDDDDDDSLYESVLEGNSFQTAQDSSGLDSPLDSSPVIRDSSDLESPLDSSPVVRRSSQRIANRSVTEQSEGRYRMRRPLNQSASETPVRKGSQRIARSRLLGNTRKYESRLEESGQIDYESEEEYHEASEDVGNDVDVYESDGGIEGTPQEEEYSDGLEESANRTLEDELVGRSYEQVQESLSDSWSSERRSQRVANISILYENQEKGYGVMDGYEQVQKSLSDSWSSERRSQRVANLSIPYEDYEMDGYEEEYYEEQRGQAYQANVYGEIDAYEEDYSEEQIEEGQRRPKERQGNAYGGIDAYEEEEGMEEEYYEEQIEEEQRRPKERQENVYGVLDDYEEEEVGIEEQYSEEQTEEEQEQRRPQGRGSAQVKKYQKHLQGKRTVLQQKQEYIEDEYSEEQTEEEPEQRRPQGRGSARVKKYQKHLQGKRTVLQQKQEDIEDEYSEEQTEEEQEQRRPQGRGSAQVKKYHKHLQGKRTVLQQKQEYIEDEYSEEQTEEEPEQRRPQGRGSAQVKKYQKHLQGKRTVLQQNQDDIEDENYEEMGVDERRRVPQKKSQNQHLEEKRKALQQNQVVQSKEAKSTKSTQRKKVDRRKR